MDQEQNKEPRRQSNLYASLSTLNYTALLHKLTVSRHLTLFELRPKISSICTAALLTKATCMQSTCDIRSSSRY